MEPAFTGGEVARILGISKVTLRNWEQRGWVVTPERDPGTHVRMYTEADIEALRVFKNRNRGGIGRPYRRLSPYRPVDAEGERIPWGGYKGKLLTELPDDYLNWLATIQTHDVDNQLREAAVAEVKRRAIIPAPDGPAKDFWG